MRRNLPIPEELFPLVSRGWIGIRVSRISTGPSAVGWTMWDERTERWEICIREDAAEKLNDEELVEVIRHEAAHIALNHFKMFNDCRKQCAAIAADVAVNYFIEEDILQSIDKKMEINSHYASQWLETLGFPQRYIPAPFIDDELHKLMQENEQQGGGSCGPNCPGGHGQPGGAGEGDEEGNEEGQGEHPPMESELCGGAENAEAAAGNPMAEATGTLVAAAVGKQYGLVGADSRIRLDRAAEAPEWIRYIFQYVRSLVEVTLAEARSHSKPQQALRQMDIHVPTLKPRWKPKPDTVCILVDTSGSMINDLWQIEPAVAYLRQHGLKVRLIAGDTRVTLNEEVEHLMELPGGGGTDIIPLFDAANEHNPKAVICFTDGWVPRWPEKQPYDIIWVTENNPPHGEVLRPQ